MCASLVVSGSLDAIDVYRAPAIRADPAISSIYITPRPALPHLSHTILNPLINVLRTTLVRRARWEQAHEWTGLWMSGLCPAGDKHYRRGQLTVHVDKPCSTFVARLDLGLSIELMRVSL